MDLDYDVASPYSYRDFLRRDPKRNAQIPRFTAQELVQRGSTYIRRPFLMAKQFPFNRLSGIAPLERVRRVRAHKPVEGRPAGLYRAGRRGHRPVRRNW